MVMDGWSSRRAGTSRVGCVARFPQRLVESAYLMESAERAWGVDVGVA